MFIGKNKYLFFNILVSITGRPSGEIAEDMIPELELPLSVEEYTKIYTKICENVFSKPVPLMPGAERLVRHFHDHKIPIAIATSSKRSNFHLKERFHKDFFSLFDHILISPDEPEIVRGKPDPAVFEICAKRFIPPPVSSKNVLVFEDSISGVQAAISANMNCVWITDSKTLFSTDLPPDFSPTLSISSLLHFQPELFKLPLF